MSQVLCRPFDASAEYSYVAPDSVLIGCTSTADNSSVSYVPLLLIYRVIDIHYPTRQTRIIYSIYCLVSLLVSTPCTILMMYISVRLPDVWLLASINSMYYIDDVYLCPSTRRMAACVNLNITYLIFDTPPVYIHSLYTQFIYTVYIHSLHTQFTYTVYIHSLHTQFIYTVYIHSLHTQFTYTVYIHSLHTQFTYTVYIHYTVY